MKKKLKWIVIIGLVGIVLLLGGLVLAGGSLVRAGVEKGGTAALGTETTLEGASLGLLSGRLDLSGLAIGNPEGFQEAHSLKVKTIDVQTQLTSLLGDTIHIDHIVIEALELTVEAKLGATNIGTLLKRLRGTPDDDPAPAPEAETPADEGGKKLVIGQVRIVKPRIILAESTLRHEREEVELGTIELDDVGEETTMPQLLERILAALLEAALEEGGSVGKALQKLDGLGGEIEKATDRIRKEIPAGLKGLEGDLQKGLKGLRSGGK